MKALFVAFAAGLLLTACGESGTPRERAETNFHQINQACSDKNGDYSGAYGLIAYNGSDRSRKYKDLNTGTGDDRLYINKFCYQISKLKEGSDKNSYTVMGMEEEPESEGTWYILKIKYPNEKQAQFAFLDIKGTMALGDID